MEQDKSGQGFVARFLRGEIEPNEQIFDAREQIGAPFKAIDTILAMHKNGSLSEEMFRCARQFRDDFAVAHFETLHAPDIVRIPGQHTEFYITNRQIEARDAVWEALDSLGGSNSPGSLAVWHIAGRELSLREWSRIMGLHKLQASGILVCALGVLSKDWLEERLKDG